MASFFVPPLPPSSDGPGVKNNRPAVVTLNAYHVRSQASAHDIFEPDAQAHAMRITGNNTNGTSLAGGGNAAAGAAAAESKASGSDADYERRRRVQLAFSNATISLGPEPDAPSSLSHFDSGELEEPVPASASVSATDLAVQPPSSTSAQLPNPNTVPPSSNTNNTNHPSDRNTSASAFPHVAACARAALLIYQTFIPFGAFLAVAQHLLHPDESASSVPHPLFLHVLSTAMISMVPAAFVACLAGSAGFLYALTVARPAAPNLPLALWLEHNTGAAGERAETISWSHVNHYFGCPRSEHPAGVRAAPSAVGAG
jgi:hypothetical protein